MEINPNKKRKMESCYIQSINNDENIDIDNDKTIYTLIENIKKEKNNKMSKVDYFEVEGIKYPNEFKSIQDFEFKIKKIIKESGNYLYEYDKNKLYEELEIDLRPYGVNNVFKFEDLLNLHLYTINYDDYSETQNTDAIDDKDIRRLYLENYFTNYDLILKENCIRSLNGEYNIILNENNNNGSYGKVYNCDIFNKMNEKINTKKMAIKLINLDEDRYLYFRIFQEILIHVQLLELIKNNSKLKQLIDENKIAKIPNIYKIGKIKNSDYLFILMEKIDYRKTDIFIEEYERYNKVIYNDEKQKKNMLNSIARKFTNEIFICYYQISNLLKNINELDDVNFTHQDIKCDNILFNRKNIDSNNKNSYKLEFYLIDMGLSNLKINGFLFINSYPYNLKPMENNNSYLIESSFNSKIDIFQLIFNTYYLFHTNEKLVNNILFFYKTINDFFNFHFKPLLLDSNNNNLLKEHSESYLFKINNELYNNINNSIFLSPDFLSIFSKIILKFIHIINSSSFENNQTKSHDKEYIKKVIQSLYDKNKQIELINSNN